MTNTETYTVEELREMIAVNREHTRRADRMGLREFARNCRWDRRRMEAMLEEMLAA